VPRLDPNKLHRDMGCELMFRMFWLIPGHEILNYQRHFLFYTSNQRFFGRRGENPCINRTIANIVKDHKDL